MGVQEGIKYAYTNTNETMYADTKVKTKTDYLHPCLMYLDIKL